MRNCITFILAFGFFITNSLAQEQSSFQFDPEYKSISVEGFYLNGEGSSYSAMVSWRPRLLTYKKLTWFANLGLAPVKTDGDSIAYIYELALQTDYRFLENWSAGISLGTQYFTQGNYDAGFAYGAYSSYHLPQRFYVIDTLTAGVTIIDQGQNFAMYRVGMGINF